MHTEKKHKVIITGTGRAGTTLLVELLTELGLDTGYTSSSRGQDYHEHCNAGLEREIEDPKAPYIVKNPALCETLPTLLANGQITIDFALIPIRRLDQASASRVRVGGNGRVPGGLRGTNDPSKQKTVLAENFHQLVETLTAHDIPHAFLHFPRFAQDARYTYTKLKPLLGDISYVEFELCFKKVAKPDLIHSFDGAIPTDAGAPAQAFRRGYWRKRMQRRMGRVTAFAAFFGIGWWLALWSGHREATADKHSPATPANHAPSSQTLANAFRLPPPHPDMLPSPPFVGMRLFGFQRPAWWHPIHFQRPFNSVRPPPPPLRFHTVFANYQQTISATEEPATFIGPEFFVR
jgi:hypothetical protein